MEIEKIEKIVLTKKEVYLLLHARKIITNVYNKAKNEMIRNIAQNIVLGIYTLLDDEYSTMR